MRPQQLAIGRFHINAKKNSNIYIQTSNSKSTSKNICLFWKHKIFDVSVFLYALDILLSLENRFVCSCYRNPRFSYVLGFRQKVSEIPQEKSASVGKTILTLARLNAFIFTVLLCYQDKFTNKVVGNRQKLSSGHFSSNSSMAFNQLTAAIASFVEQQCSEELQKSLFSINEARRLIFKPCLFELACKFMFHVQEMKM